MSDIRESVSSLIADGFAVVPILPGKKNPIDDGWLKKTYTPEHFDAGSNIGVKCGSQSQWRVDVDLDAPEAVRAGRSLLFETGMCHGRPGKPESHWWYICPGTKTESFKDIDGTMLVELRSDGGQTVVPPSVHMSGDVLRWERSGAAMAVGQEDLRRSVCAVAIAALFARHWPKGSRHFAAGHLAGFLLRCGFDAQWVVQIVTTAATVAGDEELEDRVKMAKDTCKNHADGKTTGAPKLKETFGNGEALVSRVYEWTGHENAEVLDRINEDFFVANYGTDTVVGYEKAIRAYDGKPDTVMVLDFEAFRRRFYNQKVGKQKLGEWWLTHPKQRRYERIVFAPHPLRANENDYNSWRGFAVTPDPNPNPENRCGRYLEHLYCVICNEKQDYFEYLLDVKALTAQFPGKPSGVAVVLRGDSGAGKGTMVELFGSLFGIHYMQVSSQAQVTGRFNHHLSNKVVLFADEAVWAGNKQDAGALKRLITEKTITVEQKYMDAVSEPNCLHLFMATNERWVWPATFQERRGFILDVQLKAFATPEYFRAIYDEWANGGAEAFLAFCLQRKVPFNRLGPIPRTTALAEQQQLSMDGVHQWWLDKLMQGELGFDAGWPKFVSTRWLYNDYIEVTNLTGARQRRSTDSAFSAELKKLMPPGANRRKRTTGVNLAKFGPPQIENMQVWGIDLPPLATCRAFFEKVVGVEFEWPYVDPTQPVLGDEVASV